MPGSSASDAAQRVVDAIDKIDRTPFGDLDKMFNGLASIAGRAHREAETLEAVVESLRAALREHGNHIVTTYDAKPIPDRNHDWMAYRHGSDEHGPVGYGASEAQAVVALLLEEDEARAEGEARAAGGR